MSTSGSRTRTEFLNGRGTENSAVINAGNPRNTSKHRGDQKETKNYSIQTWEKRFCFQVGGQPWKRVIKGERYNHLYGDVLAWKDSAGKKAFDDARARLWAEINGGWSSTRLPDPNMYIDEDIEWESQIEPELVSGMKSVIDEEDAETEEAELEKVIQERLEDIVATVWDMVESFDNWTLTSMVVGD